MEGKIPLGAILTGGAARRMGGRKADVHLCGVPMVERVWDAVGRAAERVVCIGGEPHLARLGVITVPDEFPGADSLGGIATALGYARARLGEAGWVFLAGCDMPLVSSELLLGLWRAAREEDDIVVPRTAKGYEPLCALYRVRVRPVIEAQIVAGNLRLRDMFAEVATREVGEEELRSFDPELASFRNINRPEDLAEIEKKLRLFSD